MPEPLIQLVAFVAVGVAVIVVIAVCLSGTSIGHHFLPRAVRDVVLKVLPRAMISDTALHGVGEFQIKVSDLGQYKTVNVRRLKGAVFAWTYDSSAEFPRAGKFAFSGLRHNLKTDSVTAPERIEALVQQALVEVLQPKGFKPADVDSADILITVFGALEDEATLNTISEALDEPEGHQWAAALRNALQHEDVDEVATFARGSLVLHVIHARSTKVLWRAAAMADLVVDVSEKEQKRRTKVAITKMLERFPPKPKR